MNDFKLADDIEIICEVLDITAAELASEIGVSPDTITRWKKNDPKTTPENLNKLYDFAFSEGVRLNKIK